LGQTVSEQISASLTVKVTFRLDCEDTELEVGPVVLAPEQEARAQHWLVAIGPDRLRADIGILDGEGDVQIGLHVVGRKLEDEEAVLDLDGLLERPAAGIVGEFILEDDFLALAGGRRRLPGRIAGQKDGKPKQHQWSPHGCFPVSLASQPSV